MYEVSDYQMLNMLPKRESKGNHLITLGESAANSKERKAKERFIRPLMSGLLTGIDFPKGPAREEFQVSQTLQKFTGVSQTIAASR